MSFKNNLHTYITPNFPQMHIFFFCILSFMYLYHCQLFTTKIHVHLREIEMEWVKYGVYHPQMFYIYNTNIKRFLLRIVMNYDERLCSKKKINTYIFVTNSAAKIFFLIYSYISYLTH